jgi:polyketide cyclase/dehydrase/lipid transport protein
MEWTTQHSHKTTADRDAVWALWSDVATWPEWDSGLDDVTIDGPFAPGTTGRLKPSGGPAVRFTVTETRPGEGFSDVTRLPLARMRFDHRLAESGDGHTLIEQRVTITGPLTPLWSRVIGRGIARDLPDTLRALAEHAG